MKRGGMIVCSIVAALAVTGWAGAAAAQSGSGYAFPRLHVWAYPGAFQDSTTFFPRLCVGSLGVRPDSIRQQPRTITVRFLRDRGAELRPDFGGYRVYRMEGAPDTTRAVLIRRFSVNAGDEALWHYSRVDSATRQYMCNGGVVNDSIITFVDPDSTGRFEKVCRRVDQFGRCVSIGDSVFKLVAPPGPHDGFRLWYSVTYEALNTTDNNDIDLFVPDSTNQLGLGPCGAPGDRSTCPNLNNKAYNVTSAAVEPTSGPSTNLESVAVVPNPYRATEAWDLPGGHEIHFIHLPSVAEIQIYTLSGGLVRELHHADTVRDFERWDLKNGRGQDVASGIYMYRVTAPHLEFQNRFIVIR
ncbi:MAG TPA: hypothetical protein VFK69_07840 [Candidatus Eisenbacteria bacterium]|nr:hypothetical protein [Candidatus Eisenbacteria bacterium]